MKRIHFDTPRGTVTSGTITPMGDWRSFKRPEALGLTRLAFDHLLSRRDDLELARHMAEAGHTAVPLHESVLIRRELALVQLQIYRALVADRAVLHLRDDIRSRVVVPITRGRDRRRRRGTAR